MVWVLFGFCIAGSIWFGLSATQVHPSSLSIARVSVVVYGALCFLFMVLAAGVAFFPGASP